jgi:hypothetical protein
LRQGDTTTFAYNLTTVEYRSDDNGKMWTKEWETTTDSLHPANPPAATPSFSPYSVQADGKSEVQAMQRQDANGKAEETILWSTHDAGQSWQAIGRLPGWYSPYPPLASGGRSTEPSKSNPMYLLGQDQVPALLFRIQIVQITDGRHWSALPPLPVPGATVDRLGITRLLGVTASGKLLALGVGPDEQVPGGEDQTAHNREPPGFGEHLWMWDAGAGRWTYYATPMPPADGRCLDVCWDGQVSVGDGPRGQGTYLWLRGDYPEGHQALYRMELPDV